MNPTHYLLKITRVVFLEADTTLGCFLHYLQPILHEIVKLTRTKTNKYC